MSVQIIWVAIKMCSSLSGQFLGPVIIHVPQPSPWRWIVPDRDWKIYLQFQSIVLEVREVRLHMECGDNLRDSVFASSPEKVIEEVLGIKILELRKSCGD